LENFNSSTAIYFIFAYFIGSIPTSFIFGKLFKGIDIRKAGSGNVGASNAFRVLGKKIGIAVMAIDIIKGFLPVFIAQKTVSGPNSDIILFLIGLTAVLGHMFTIFLNFKGGKGVATSGGVFLALTPKAGTICIILWMLIVAVTKMASVGSIIAALALPFLVYFADKSSTAIIIISSVISILVIYMHKKNIINLINGHELKITSNTQKEDGNK